MTSQPGLQAAMSRPIWPVTPERSSGTEDDHQAMMSATTPSTSELLAPVTGQSPASTSDETTKGENTPVTPAMVKGSLSGTLASPVSSESAACLIMSNIVLFVLGRNVFSPEYYASFSPT